MRVEIHVQFRPHVLTTHVSCASRLASACRSRVNLPRLRRKPAPNASLIIANGIVVTMDGERRVLNPGSVAIEGARIVAVDRPEAIAAQVHRRRDHRCNRARSCCPV